MKKIFFTLFLWIGFVQASTINHVWIAHIGGAQESQCRALWNEYDLRHDTKTVFQLKPGADGLLATNDMLSSTATRRFLCGGSSQVISNNLLVSNSNAIDQTEALLQTTAAAVVWYVPNQNKSQNFKELVGYLKGLNRPVNIGVFFATQKALVLYLEKSYGISTNVIMYRTQAQMYPDLASGALDLAFDTGGAVELAKETGKFQIAGYLSNINHKKLEKYPNFKNVDAEFSMFMPWQAIIVPGNLDSELKKSVGQQLQNITQSESFKKLASDYLGTATGITQPDLTLLVTRQRKIMETYSK
jgi:tripartite-type tricarboxylate transporter receptor subunit TctC